MNISVNKRYTQVTHWRTHIKVCNTNYVCSVTDAVILSFELISINAL